MNQETYNRVTTASLVAIALSAILYDRIPGYGWLFGIIAGACAIISAWVYLAYGMNKDRPNAAPPAVTDQLNDVGATDNATAVLLEAVAPVEAGYWHDFAYRAELRQTKMSVYSLEVPQQRTVAEEVVEIVRGLTALTETPMYELEIKSDGTLKVVPCDQMTRKAWGGKLLKRDTSAVDAEAQPEEPLIQ